MDRRPRLIPIKLPPIVISDPSDLPPFLSAHLPPKLTTDPAKASEDADDPPFFPREPTYFDRVCEELYRAHGFGPQYPHMPGAFDIPNLNHNGGKTRSRQRFLRKPASELFPPWDEKRKPIKNSDLIKKHPEKKTLIKEPKAEPRKPARELFQPIGPLPKFKRKMTESQIKDSSFNTVTAQLAQITITQESENDAAKTVATCADEDKVTEPATGRRLEKRSYNESDTETEEVHAVVPKAEAPRHPVNIVKTTKEHQELQLPDFNYLMTILAILLVIAALDFI